MPSGPVLLEICAFLLGLLFGSFLNVCIIRLPAGRSVVRPGSACPTCGEPIRWFDNLPVLSWLLLRGRCRRCHARISWQYPAVELATGFWLLLAMRRLLPLFSVSGPVSLPTETLLLRIVAAVGFAVLGWLLLGLLVTDWQTLILPDAFTLGGLALAFFLVCTQAILLAPGEGEVRLGTHHVKLASPGNVVDHGNLFLTGPEALIGGRLVAVTAAALLLLLLRWLYRTVRGREGLGLGDVKLLALIAGFLGFLPALLALFLGVIAGGLYAVVLLSTGRADGRSRIPLGSFLSAGGLVAALYGEEILRWYKALL